MNTRYLSHIETAFIVAILGELANFFAYAMIPAALVASLGSFGVVATSVAASFVLEEKLNLVGKMASFLTMVGNLVAIIHAPRVSIKQPI